MKPHEKAKKLFYKFYLVNSESIELDTGEHELLFSLSQDDAKQCALIAVDEIINELNVVDSFNPSVYDYWREVILEIDKL